MAQEDDLRFPNYADEEQMVGPLTVSEAGIIVGTIFFIILTKQFFLILILGFIVWKGYQVFKETGSSNAIRQMIYKLGLSVPRSHLFNEPSISEFRE